MTYVGKKPADIIATAVDTTTGTFSGDLTVDTNTLYVDSANNRVGVGTVSPATALDVTGTATMDGLTVDGIASTSITSTNGNILNLYRSGTGSDSVAINFYDGSNDRSQIKSSDGGLSFHINGTTRAVDIDASGNLLVGKTTTAFGTAGVRILPTGNIYPVANGSVPLEINRLTSDGDIVKFYKDSSAVGSIGTTSGDLTLDVAGDFTLDVGGGDIAIKDDGTEFGRMVNSSTDFVIQSSVNDKDLIFKGKDNNAVITALTLDMSDAGTAIFNHDIKLNDAQLIRFGSSQDSDIAHYADNQLAFRNTTGTMTFYTGPTPTERMKLDANGNLLVGTTTNGTTSDGTVIRASAETLMTRSNGAPLLLNRRGTDGAVIEVRNDNSAVGYITANAGGMGVYLGGTGSANHLDDYEEGTWTPDDTSGWSSATIITARYTKIGRMVHINLYMTSLQGKNSNAFKIGGLPFTVTSNVFSTGVLETDSNGHVGFVRLNSFTTQLSAFYTDASTSQRVTFLGNDVGNHVIFSAVYETSA